jgi:hypothetical protein
LSGKPCESASTSRRLTRALARASSERLAATSLHARLNAPRSYVEGVGLESRLFGISGMRSRRVLPM